MKHYILSFSYTLIATLFTLNTLLAQVKVTSGGNVAIGSTSGPISGSRLHVIGGYTTFTATYSIPTSSAFIRGLDTYSTATTPDYSWWGNDQTGFYHPAANVIGVTVGGVMSMKFASSGQVSIGGNPYSSYSFTVNGSAYCSSVWTASDKRYKTNVQPIQGALNKVLSINGKTYQYDTQKYQSRNFNKGTNLGFIAQEVLQVVPEAVQSDSNGFYSMNYDAIIPLLVEAVKEQQQIIDKQNTRISTLESQNETTSTLYTDNFSSAVLVAKLYQNNPNPFSQDTEVKSTIPSGVTNADLFIYDMQGSQVKKINIVGRNEVITIIRGTDLKAGMYFYTLIIDGKEVDTKRMILTN
ncbi:MAG: hypothetical protein JWO58_2972 [Chitinophagaceae bacterium]|nr:hypothetical protein [Chitinophagaceae bacterium]